jgi:DNA-directed RNA polymerase specialized sigma24 family protein
MSFRDEARRALESSAARDAQNKYLDQIRERHPALSRYQRVEDLLSALRNPQCRPDEKDAALLALLEEHQSQSAGGAFVVLAVAMFPALDRIYRTRLHRTGERDDLWGRVVSAFAEALERYPVDRRRSKVAANIEGDTMASLRRAQLRDARATVAQEQLTAAVAPFLSNIEAIDPQEDESNRIVLGDFVNPGRRKAVDPEELAAAKAAVAPIFEANAIGDDDRFLVLGVHLYERTLGDLAQELGISREAAKKRHQRAITRIRSARKGPVRKK